MPSTMAGSPSITNSQCQPLSPPRPCSSSSAPEIGPSHQGGERDRRHEQRDDARPLARREPIGEIEDDAGEEAGFGDTEQEAHDVEARLPADQGHGGGDDPPAHHDARDPDARAESLQREIARHLEQEIADEEDAGAGSEHRRREAEILVHGERGEADIHPVEEIHRVAKDEKREEPARGLGDRAPCRLVAIHPALPLSRRQAFSPLKRVFATATLSRAKRRAHVAGGPGEESSWLRVDGISGTSAGAMNAVVLVDGLARSGADGARAALETFWRKVSEAARHSPFQRTPLDVIVGRWTLDYSPAFVAMDLMSRVFSPYELNPGGANPLRDILAETVDFDRVARAPVKLFVTATNVRTGRGRVFRNAVITPDVLLASACLPTMFQAIEIDGESYWDGGYSGNHRRCLESPCPAPSGHPCRYRAAAG